MNAILVDDEIFSMDYLETVCNEFNDIKSNDKIDIIGKFSNPYDVFSFAEENKIDIAFLDIEMPEINGIEIAKRLRQINSEISVIFVTGYNEYALDAFKVDAVSYLIKPCVLEDIEKAVQKAKKLQPSKRKNIFIRTFGYFDIFIDSQPIYFSNAKAKELLALLVDRRGGIVTMEQIINILWEDRPYDHTVKQLYRKAIIYINQLLKDKKADFFVSNRGSCYIKTTDFDCDYYQLLSGDKSTVSNFNGKYMFEYEWAEETLIRIEKFISLNY